MRNGFSTVVNISPRHPKLKIANKTTALFKAEESVNPFERIFFMICQPPASIIDLFAGPQTAGIASLRKWLSAVQTVEDSPQYSYGIVW